MAAYTRKTFNEAFGQSPLEPGPSPTLQFMRSRRELKGSFTTMSLAAAPFTFGATAWMLAGYKLGWGVLSLPFEAGYGAVKATRFLQKLGGGQPEYATPMVDTRQAYTMRQAALQTMHNSAYSIRSAIGHEARLLHS